MAVGVVGIVEVTAVAVDNFSLSISWSTEKAERRGRVGGREREREEGGGWSK